MRVMKYSDGWTRRHFLEQVGKSVFAAGVINPLMDVIGRGPVTTITFSPSGVHPTPYLRGLLSCELLGRMGFPRRAERYRRMWRRIYPNPAAANLEHGDFEHALEAAGAAHDHGFLRFP